MSQQVILPTPDAHTPTQLIGPTATTPGQACVSTTDGWELYPEGVNGFNPFECDASEARSRVRDQAGLIFSDNDISVDVIDASGKLHRSFWERILIAYQTEVISKLITRASIKRKMF